MEEESGVKAPVTRLRRRLSVELSEESKSPGPATPTKKRGGKLAAKPQLELIDENTPHNSPKKTTRRRSIARDIAEEEEKLLTPTRRSSRIKSNTSIVSDTPQALDTPRAKRALRRNSHVGSDTETSTPVTPARASRTRKDSTTSLDKQATTTSASGTPVTPARIRRTRKNSASSVDKPAENEEISKTALINEVIAEEPENKLRKSVTNDESPNEKKTDGSPSSPRKSPRLLAKKIRKRSTSQNEPNESLIHEPDANMNISAGKAKLDGSMSERGDVKIVLEHVSDRTSQSRLLVSNDKILNNINEDPNKKPNMNKSPSSLKIPSDIRTKRHRTKSWSTLSSSSPKEGSFYSDNESTKKKIKNKTLTLTTRQASKDIKTNQSLEEKVQEENDTKIYLNNSMNKKKKRHSQNSESDRSMKETILNQSNNINSSTIQSPRPSKDKPEGNKENFSDKTSKNPAEYLFKKAPSSSIQSMLFIEDSDTDSLGKTNKNAEIANEDQCVPEVEQVKNDESPKESNILNIPAENQLFSSLPTTTNNDTCEPMDIDETLPDSVSLNDHLEENGSVSESKSKTDNLQKSSFSISHNVSAIKSNRKSSLSDSLSQEQDATDNGNKSTLILSQIKELSTGFQDTSKPSDDSRQVNELLSTSLKEPEINKKVVNKNISMSCLTSTPVQQKDDQKLPLKMNTSAITPHNDSKKVNKDEKKNIYMVSQSSQPVSSDEGSDDDSEDNSLIVDEAEDAGENYESGDSQDEEERQYERDHEVLDKGVTLTSDEDVSNDSDYEKDSFVVSSDEEDNELLSGSGEDLDLSDNELTMSAKSKKKFNERLSKQQKKASREMFQARHELEITKQSTASKVGKNNRQRLDSSLLESDDDAVVPPKKKKRMRLESTMDSSSAKSDTEEPKLTKTQELKEIVATKKKSKRLSESMLEPGNEMEVSISKNLNYVQDKSVSNEIEYKKKKFKRLSESISNDSGINEKEITAICDTTTADDPLHLQIKQEPKTPQKDFDISTVHFTVREEIEQVQVNNDVSIIKGDETSDPLQSSMAQDENDEDSDDDNSSISENEEITKNYDSLLNGLNENTKPKVKSVDVSLNLIKKEKKKLKQPIIDQLNITQTKTSKSKKKADNKECKSIFKKAIPEDDDSSDSIDLKLLFSDDSNDSEKGFSAVQNKTERKEKTIPLKRTEGSTNLSISLNASQIQTNDTSLNTSSKKKSKRKSTQKENATIDEPTLPFFIDTLGTREEHISSSESTMKMKNKNNIPVNSYSEVGIDGKSKAMDSADDAPIEVSNTSLKKKKKLKIVSLSGEEDATVEPDTNDKSTDHLTKTPGTEKKKKKVKQDGKSGKSKAMDSADDAPTEVSNTSLKKKNKLKIVSLSGEEDATVEPDTNDKSTDHLTKTPGTEKKKKKDKQDGKSGKCKAIDSADDAPTEVSNTSLKKKNKLKIVSLSGEEDATVEPDTNDKSTDHLTKTPGTEKKKKKVKQDGKSGKELPITEAYDKSVNDLKAAEESSSEVSNKKDSGNIPTINIPNLVNESLISNSKKKRKLVQNENIGPAALIFSGNMDKTLSDKMKPLESKGNDSGEKSRKRKEREDDVHDKKSKVLKKNSSDKQVPRLPTTILDQLEEKPKRQIIETKTPKVVSTTEFMVEEARIKRSKPSNFLEESIYLNTDSESPNVKKEKLKVKKPVVLPFTPTASISDSGFTTKFHITPLPQKIEFVAQRIETTNYKTDYLNARRSKKMRTHELKYKNHRNLKLTKY